MSNSVTRPMLAETCEDISKLNYPVMVSPKLDGIRCVIVDGKALTRKFKPIPNNFVRAWLETHCPSGLDGELMIKGKSFNEIQSAIMSEDGEPDFEYHVFDFVGDRGLGEAYCLRYDGLSEAVGKVDHPRVQMVYHDICEDADDVRKYEEEYLDAGYEGLMVRCPQGQYKCGRSTLKQGWLLKVKRFADSEAEVLGIEELMTNTNEAQTNELGLTKRSSAKAGLKPAGLLGQFKVRDLATGLEFFVGTGDGLTRELRREIWENRERYVGKIIKYKYQPAGQKELPRFPVWLGFRDSRDM